MVEEIEYLTAEDLRKAGACEPASDRFELYWPAGCPLTKESQKEAVGRNFGVHVVWAVENMLEKDFQVSFWTALEIYARSPDYLSIIRVSSSNAESRVAWDAEKIRLFCYFLCDQRKENRIKERFKALGYPPRIVDDIEPSSTREF